MHFFSLTFLKLAVIAIVGVTILILAHHYFLRRAENKTPVVKKEPDFIIIGVRKCGTSALINILDSHPQIGAANVEIHYFDDVNKYKKKGLPWYISRMPSSQQMDGLVVEKTPSYFVVPDVPKRIKESLSETLKLILIVCDPIRRSISDYTQLNVKRMARRKPVRSFEDFVFKKNGKVRNSTRVITDSLYDVHYKRWLQYFSSNKIFIVDGDQLVSNPLIEVLKIEEYLRIDPYFNAAKFYFNETKGFYCWMTESEQSQCLGNDKGRKHPNVSDDVKSTLKTYFQIHIENFCALTHLKTLSLCRLYLPKII